MLSVQISCAYVLRLRGVVTSTGRLTLDKLPEVGDRLALNGKLVLVHDVDMREGEPFLTLVDPDD